MSTLAAMVFTGIGLWELLILGALSLFMLGVIGLIVFVAVKAAQKSG